MSLYLRDTRVCVIIAVCVPLLTAGIGICSDANNNKPATDINASNGPTVTLSYSSQTPEKNSFASFMYFVPLVSPTLVDVETSADNRQQAGTVSYVKKVTSKTFYVSCEFEMTGNGFHKYTFDDEEVITAHTGELKKGQTLVRMIDYMKFDGAGFGRIEVKGTISGSTRTVTEVDLYFNARGRKSPVTIGLYDVKPVDGLYKYENRTNELVARVDAFIFKKGEDEPKMGIKLASIDKASTPNGFLAGLKGAIANLFVNPPGVSRIGNDTMLDFGLALLNEKPAFTFPKAENIRQNKTVAISNNQ